MEENNILKVEKMEIINLGLVGFYDSINSQNVRLIEILDRLKELG